MLGKAIQVEIEEMIAARDFEELRATLADLDVADIAEIIEDLPPDDQAVIFRLLPRGMASEAFEHLAVEIQECLVRSLSLETVGEILNAMSPDDRTRLLEELPGGVTQRLLKTLNPAELKVARQLLGYPEESIGRLMTPEYVSARMNWTVGETLDHIRKSAAQAETISYTYIVDEKGRLIDDVHLARLVLADPALKLSDLIESNVVSLSAFDDREEAVTAFRKYDRFALPVVDREGVLLGIVTLDDVLDVEQAEATEDVQKFGGQAALEDSYFHTGILTLVKKRAGWLSILFLSGFLTSGALEFFDSLLHQFVILSIFLPLVIASGGNSGSQSASLVIRSLATREMELGDWWRVLRRELTIGLSLGLFLSGIFVLRLLIQYHQTPSYALLGFMAVTGVVTFGAVIGALMPFFFKRIGLDPAVSSGPFIATFVDFTGIVIYLSLASWLLS